LSTAYDETALADRSYTAAEVDAALAALVEPGRLAHAQDVVTHAAPALQRILAEALAEGGWFGEVHDAEISRVAGALDERERAAAVGTLVAELARELELGRRPAEGESGVLEHQENQTPTEEH
jgi:hypothetical protein